jgi:serine/threonine protein phosphatase PrpC
LTSYIAIKILDRKFLKIAKAKSMSDGSTCLMAMVANGQLTVANVGDSSALLIRKGQMIEITSE